jgi:hypothetical protein
MGDVVPLFGCEQVLDSGIEHRVGTSPTVRIPAISSLAVFPMTKLSMPLMPSIGLSNQQFPAWQ